MTPRSDRPEGPTSVDEHPLGMLLDPYTGKWLLSLEYVGFGRRREGLQVVDGCLRPVRSVPC